MKKILLSAGVASILLGDTFKLYTFTLKENYKEKVHGYVVDEDYNNFGDMYGIGFGYKKNLKKIVLSVNGEYSLGKKNYNGATQDGKPMKVTVNNSYLYNIKAGVEFSPYYIKLGYRFWNRGNSNAPGDYNEQYYWSYLAGGIDYGFVINKLFIKTDIQYQYAINPELKIYLGNDPVISLGKTRGFMGKFELGYPVSNNSVLGINYKYDFWHINASKQFVLLLNNQEYVMIEPESYTKNQYLSIYYQFDF